MHPTVSEEHSIPTEHRLGSVPKRKRQFLRLLWLCGLAACSAAPLQVEQPAPAATPKLTGYRVIDLGPGHANSISENHHVGGYGFVWDPDAGRQETSKGWYFANDAGEYAGSYSPPDTDSRPCRWSAVDGITELGEAGMRGYAHSINDEGVVTGWYGAGNALHAFVWTPDGQGQDLHRRVGLPAESASVAVAMDDAGRVLVSAFEHGSFLVDGAQVQQLSPFAMRTVNGRGDALFDDRPLLLTSAGEELPFPSPSGYEQCRGRGLNEKAEVVGICMLTAEAARKHGLFHGGWYGFVWTENGFALLDTLLQSDVDPEGGPESDAASASPTWHVEYADALSDDGWIVGSAMRAGENRAVVLVPTSDRK